MGATYTLFTAAVANAAAKNLLTIHNATGSAKVVYLRRLYVANAQTGTVSGGMGLMMLGRFTGTYTGGTVLTTSLITMDTTNAALPAQITATTNSTGITIADLFRRITICTDEYAVSDATGDVLTLIPKFSTIWDSGYTDSNVQPITLRENEGITLQTPAAGIWNAAGSFNIFAEVEVI